MAKSGRIWNALQSLGYDFTTLYVNVFWEAVDGKLIFKALPKATLSSAIKYPHNFANGTLDHSSRYMRLRVVDTKGSTQTQTKQWSQHGGAGDWDSRFLEGRLDQYTPTIITDAITGTYNIQVAHCTNSDGSGVGATKYGDFRIEALPEIYANSSGDRIPIVDIKVKLENEIVTVIDVKIHE